MYGVCSSAARRHSWFRFSWVALVAGVTLSCSIAGVRYHNAERQDHQSFNNAAEVLAGSLTAALDRNADAATSVAALARSMPGLTNRKFQDWYTAIGADRPEGSPAIGFIRYVPGARLGDYLAGRQGDLALDGTTFTSSEVVPPGKRPGYCLAELGVWRITELALPVGLDYCATQPTMMAQADNRTTSVTPAVSQEFLEGMGRMLGEPITEIRESLKGAYFYSTPVFARDVMPDNGDLHPGLLGWVGGFFRPRDLVSASRPDNARLNVGLTHVNAPGDVTSVVKLGTRWPVHFRYQQTVDIDGEWRIDIAGSGLRGGLSPLVQALLVGGVSILVNLLLFLLFRVLVSAQANAVALVERRTGELRAANQDRAQLLKGTLEVAEREQSRLAAELHDGPIQKLTASCFVVDRAVRRLKRNDYATATTLLEQVRTELSEDTAALRTMMIELRPPLLDEAGLSVGLQSYADAFAARTGIVVDFVGRLGDIDVPPDMEVTLYRIGQQSLANIDAHAAATHVVIVLQVIDRSAIELVVRDNGRGFDTATAHELLRAGHYGLAGMRERIEVAGGTWTIKSAQGAGTTISARVPIEIDTNAPDLLEVAS